MRLGQLTGQSAPALLPRLEELRHRAGAGPVVWLLQPYQPRVSAFAFGGFRRRFVAVSGGAAVAAVRRPELFTGVVLHELAHVRNRDITQTYLAVAIWRAFVVAAVVPLAVLLIVGDLSSPWRITWRVAVLALTVYLLRNSIVRSREFDADARVRELDPDTALGQVLESMPPRPGRGLWHLGWLHPSGQERAAALLDPKPLFQCGFWDGLAIGLVTAIGASAAQELMPQFTTANFLKFLVPAVLFALLGSAALVIAMWRRQLFQPPVAAGTFAGGGWAAGLGWGAGLAIGPVIAIQTALDKGVAPDSVNPAAVGFMAAGIGLTIVIFMPFPVWAGYWADAWQRPSGSALRVPARGGLVTATAGAWVVLTFSLYFLLSAFVNFEGILSDPIDRHAWAQIWPSLGVIIAGMAGAWIVCLVMVAVPLVGALYGRRSQAGDQAGAPPWLGRAGRVAALCLVGIIAATAVTMAVNAVAHARIAGPVRWDAFFKAALVSFDLQAVVAVAVIFAMIAAARIMSLHSFTIAVAVAAIVAAAGAVIVVNSDSIGFCVGAVSIQYTHPPANLCPSFLGGGFLAHQIWLYATEAALVSILFIPGAHRFGEVLPRLAALPRSAVVLGAAGAAAAVVVALTAVGFWGAETSTHNIQPLGSIGNDGWINGAGYEIRLHPDWFERTRGTGPGQMIIIYTVPGPELDIFRVSAGRALASFRYAMYFYRVHQIRPRPALIGGMPEPGVAGLAPGGAIVEASLVRHGSFDYIVVFTTPSADQTAPESELAEMLQTWHWE
jgi:hypothetical protein